MSGAAARRAGPARAAHPGAAGPRSRFKRPSNRLTYLDADLDVLKKKAPSDPRRRATAGRGLSSEPLEDRARPERVPGPRSRLTCETSSHEQYRTQPHESQSLFVIIREKALRSLFLFF